MRRIRPRGWSYEIKIMLAAGRLKMGQNKLGTEHFGSHRETHCNRFVFERQSLPLAFDRPFARSLDRIHYVSCVETEHPHSEPATQEPHDMDVSTSYDIPSTSTLTAHCPHVSRHEFTENVIIFFIYQIIKKKTSRHREGE